MIVGDSIANGLGKLVGGVPCQSWGQWLADTLGLSFTRYAIGGAPVATIRAELVPRVQARYDIACLSAGTNNTKGDSRLGDVERDLDAIVAHLAAHADRVVAIGLPPRLNLLGNRTDPARIADVNTILRRVAERHGAAFAPLDWFQGHRLFRGDNVHPSAFGYLAIADAAAEALGLHVLPSAHAGLNPQGNRSGLEEVVYAAEHAKARLWSLRQGQRTAHR